MVLVKSSSKDIVCFDGVCVSRSIEARLQTAVFMKERDRRAMHLFYDLKERRK